MTEQVKADTPDPAELIAAALDEAFARRNGSTDEHIRAAHADTARTAVAALAAAGVSAVAVESSRTEWGAQRTPKYGSTVAGSMAKAEAESFARLAQDPATGEPVTECLVRRTVYVGPWEPVDGDA
jgi:hypothetical protein